MDGRDPPTDDEDADGLPDYWENQFFGNTWSQTGLGDADGDGLRNLQEYQLGTYPTNSNTLGRFIATQRLAANHVEITLQGEVGRAYRLEISDSLAAWRPLTTQTNST